MSYHLHRKLNKFDFALASCYLDLQSYIPVELYEQYVESKQKLQYAEQSLKSVLIPENLRTLDLIPYHILESHASSENEIIQYVKVNKISEKNVLTKFYIKALEIERYLSEIPLNLTTNQYNKIFLRFLSGKTLRTTYSSESFPILSLPKTERHIIQPNNDFFLELDYNSADIRSLLACLGIEQPDKDVYQFLIDEHSLKSSREELKKSLLVWLHAPEYYQEFNSVFDRDKLLDMYYKDGFLTNPYGFKIDVDKDKAIGYLAQSTTAVVLLNSMYSVISHLIDKNFKTRVSFSIHDSIVLDACYDEDLSGIKDIFESTKFGKFLSKQKTGKNYGEMK